MQAEPVRSTRAKGARNMQHLTVTAVMTHSVVTADPESSVKQIVQLLRDNDVAARLERR